MKKLLLLIIITLGCKEQEIANCSALCVQPNINDLIELTLNFQNAGIGDTIRLIRINRTNQLVIDTLDFRLTDSREVVIGRGSTVGFSETTTTSDAIEEATLDFTFLLFEKQTNRISNIEIERVLPQNECGCIKYQISTLELDGNIIEVNSDDYSIYI